MYRLAVEALLGISLEVDKLRLEPQLPEKWDGCKVHFRFRETFYHIALKRTAGTADKVVKVIVDGRETEGPFVRLADDRVDHQVEVLLG